MSLYANRFPAEGFDFSGKRVAVIGTGPNGVQTTQGHVDVDVIVFATGFDAVTGALDRIDIRGRDGALLRDAWAEGPRTLLGLQVAGFPDVFTITGPGSPSVHTSMVVAIEQHVDWIGDCLMYVRTPGAAAAGYEGFVCS